MDCALPVAEKHGLSVDVLAYNTSIPTEWEEEREDSDGPDGSSRAPYNPYGLIFLRRIIVGDVPRLRIGGPVLPIPSFRYWFNATLPEIQLKYLNTGIINRTALLSRRSTTNKGQMPVYVNWTGAPQPPLFDLAAQGYSLPPPAQDDGSDQDDRDSPPPEVPINDFISQLWRQFITDVTGKSPNPRGITNASYLKLTPTERRTGNENVFMNITLPAIFTDVMYRPAPIADWKRAFKWLFPGPGFKTSSGVQSYPSCPYYKQWLAFVGDNYNRDPALVDATRAQLWNRLRTWQWIPDAQQDKMWPTKAVQGFTRWPAATNPGGNIKAAPRILMKPNVLPILVMDIIDSDDDEPNEEDDEDVIMHLA